MSRNVYRALIIGTATLFSIVGFHFTLFDSWQEQLIDRMFLSSEQPKGIVVVAADETSLAEFGQWPWPRAEFAKAIQNLQEARIIGFDIHFAEPSRLGSEDDARFAEAIRNSKVPIVLPVEIGFREGGAVLTTEPLPLFETASTQGFVNVELGPDGILRELRTKALLNNGRTVESFSKVLSGEGSTVPHLMRIFYAGPAKTILTVSMADVARGALPPSLFKDSYVLLGATAESLRDNFKTPFGLMPGVEVHANALHTIIEGKHLTDLPPAWAWALLAAVSLLAGLAVAYVRNFLGLMALFVGLVVILVLKSFVAFSFGIVTPLLYVLLTVVLTGAAMLAFEVIAESKEKQFIRKSFQQYLSPTVVAELMKNPEKLRLGGEKKRVTVLFSDIRSFTTISEGLSPESLTQLMNEYLTAMTDIIMEHGGLVDKYIGDAIMAFWGAPIENPHQERDAAEAVQKMSKKIDELNEEWQKRGIPHVSMGVGLNTGEVIVGNMGSLKRFNYTIMGDEVNFASRLESLTKKYGALCLMSESTYQKIGNDVHFKVRELDTVRVKGKREPKKIYQLMTGGIASESIRVFEYGRTAYVMGKWDEAIGHFKKALSYGPDATSELFIQRCEELREHPPVNWNGIYDHETK